MLTEEQIEDLVVFLTDEYDLEPFHRIQVAYELKDNIIAWQETYGDHMPDKISDLEGFTYDTP